MASPEISEHAFEPALINQKALLCFFTQYLQCIGCGTIALDIENQLLRANQARVDSNNSDFETAYKYVEKAMRPMETVLTNCDHQFFVEKIIPSLNERATFKCADDPCRLQPLFRVEMKCLLFLVRYNNNHTTLRHRYMSNFESRYDRLFDKLTKQFCLECRKFYDDALPVLQLGNASDEDGSSRKFQTNDASSGAVDLSQHCGENPGDVNDGDFVHVLREINNNAASAVIPQLVVELRFALTHTLVNIGQHLQAISRGFTRYGRVMESPLEEFAKLKDLNDCIQTCEFLQSCMAQTSNLQQQLMKSKMLEERIMDRYKSMLDSALQLLIRFVQEASNASHDTESRKQPSRNKKAPKIEKRRKTEIATRSSNITLGQFNVNTDDENADNASGGEEGAGSSRTMAMNELAASFLPVIKNISETQVELQKSAKEWNTFQDCVQESNNQVSHANRLFEVLVKNFTDLKQRLEARREKERATPTVKLGVSRSQHVQVGSREDTGHLSKNGPKAAPPSAEVFENSATISRLKRQLGANQFLLEESYQLFSNYLKYSKIDSDDARFVVKKLQATLEYQAQKDGIKSIKPTTSRSSLSEQHNGGSPAQPPKPALTPQPVVKKTSSPRLQQVETARNAEKPDFAQKKSSTLIAADETPKQIRNAQRRAKASNERRAQQAETDALKMSPSKLSPRSTAQPSTSPRPRAAHVDSSHHLTADNDGFRLTTDSHLSPLHASPSMDDLSRALRLEEQQQPETVTSRSRNAQSCAKASRENYSLMNEVSAVSESQQERPRSAHSTTDQSSLAAASTSTAPNNSGKRQQQEQPKPPPRPLRTAQQQQKHAEDSLVKRSQQHEGEKKATKPQQQRPVPTVNVIKDNNSIVGQQQQKSKAVKAGAESKPFKSSGTYETVAKNTNASNSSDPKPTATGNSATKKPKIPSSQTRSKAQNNPVNELQNQKRLKMPQLTASVMDAQKEAIARGLPPDDELTTGGNLSPVTRGKNMLPPAATNGARRQQTKKAFPGKQKPKSKSPATSQRSGLSESSRSVSAGGPPHSRDQEMKKDTQVPSHNVKELKIEPKMKLLESDGSEWKQRYGQHRERVRRASMSGDEDIMATRKMEPGKIRPAAAGSAPTTSQQQQKYQKVAAGGRSDAEDSEKTAAGAASSAAEHERPKTHTIKHRTPPEQQQAKSTKFGGKKPMTNVTSDETAAAAAAAAAVDQAQQHSDANNTTSSLDKKSSKVSLKATSSRKNVTDEKSSNSRQKPPRTSKFSGGGTAGGAPHGPLQDQLPESLNAPGSTVYYQREEHFQRFEQFPSSAGNRRLGGHAPPQHFVVSESTFAYTDGNNSAGSLNRRRAQQQLPGGVMRDVVTTPTAGQIFAAEAEASEGDEIVEVVDTALAEPFYSSADDDEGGVFQYMPAPTQYPAGGHHLGARGRRYIPPEPMFTTGGGRRHWRTDQLPSELDEENISDGYGQYDADDNVMDNSDAGMQSHNSQFNTFYYFPS